MNKRLFFIGTAVLSACTVGPDYRRPDIAGDADVAKALSLDGSSALALKSDWYTAFNDAALDKLVETALAGNPTIEEGTHTLLRARRLLAAQKTAFFPVLDASGGYTKLKPSHNVAAAVRENYYTAGFDASWELDLWGAGRRKTEAAEAAVRSAEATLDDTRLRIKAEVVTVYVKLRSAQKRLRLLKQTSEIRKILSDIAETRRRTGLTAQTELLSALIEESALNAQIPLLEQAVDSYRNALAVLTGKLPDDGFLPDGTGDENDVIADKSFDCDLSALYALPANVIRHRPDVRAAEAGLIAANAEIGQAVAALYPNVSLGALFGFQSDTFGRLLSHNSNMVNLTPSVSLPLFHWNALTNAVKAAEEGEKAQRAAYKNVVLNAVRDLKDAMTRVAKTYSVWLKNKKAAERTRGQTVLTMKLYRSGLVPLSRALESVQSLQNARSAEIESKAAAYQAIAAFYKAAGV